jgi:hypothetical protein
MEGIVSTARGVAIIAVILAELAAEFTRAIRAGQQSMLKRPIT